MTEVEKQPPKTCPHCGGRVEAIRYGYVVGRDFDDVGDLVLGGGVVFADARGRPDPSHACGGCGTRWSPDGEERSRNVRVLRGYE
jgi:hypothetical protein